MKSEVRSSAASSISPFVDASISLMQTNFLRSLAYSLATSAGILSLDNSAVHAEQSSAAASRNPAAATRLHKVIISLPSNGRSGGVGGTSTGISGDMERYRLESLWGKPATNENIISAGFELARKTTSSQLRDFLNGELSTLVTITRPQDQVRSQDQRGVGGNRPVGLAVPTFDRSRIPQVADRIRDSVLAHSFQPEPEIPDRERSLANPKVNLSRYMASKSIDHRVIIKQVSVVMLSLSENLETLGKKSPEEAKKVFNAYGTILETNNDKLALALALKIYKLAASYEDDRPVVLDKKLLTEVASEIDAVFAAYEKKK